LIKSILSHGSSLLKSIDTSVDANNVLTGSILINLSGEIVGARINSGTLAKNSFIPINQIKTFLQGK
jgi:hypothetical protein